MNKANNALSSSFSGSAKDNELADVIDTLMPSVVNIAVLKDGQQGAGSGFVYDSGNGYVITNNHVVRDAEVVKIITNDERILSATVIGTDKYTDIAVLKVESKKPLQQAALGDSDKMRVGYNTIAIGAPFGLAGTVTTGIISARDRDIHSGPYDQFLQHDASINPGNSGGPLFNMAGQVIGVNTMILSRSGSSAGIGLAIPVNQAIWVADQIIAHGEVRWGYLGATVRKAQDEDADKFRMAEAKGVVIEDLSPNGPAASSGLRKGDVVLGINGMEAKTARFLTREIAKVTAGKTALLDIWRDGTQQSVAVTVGLRPAEAKPIIVPNQDGPQEDQGAMPRRRGMPPAGSIPEELLPFLMPPRGPRPHP